MYLPKAKLDFIMGLIPCPHDLTHAQGLKVDRVEVSRIASSETKPKRYGADRANDISGQKKPSYRTRNPIALG